MKIFITILIILSPISSFAECKYNKESTVIKIGNEYRIFTCAHNPDNTSSTKYTLQEGIEGGHWANFLIFQNKNTEWDSDNGTNLEGQDFLKFKQAVETLGNGLRYEEVQELLESDDLNFEKIAWSGTEEQKEALEIFTDRYNRFNNPENISQGRAKERTKEAPELIEDLSPESIEEMVNNNLRQAVKTKNCAPYGDKKGIIKPDLIQLKFTDDKNYRMAIMPISLIKNPKVEGKLQSYQLRYIQPRFSENPDMADNSFMIGSDSYFERTISFPDKGEFKGHIEWTGADGTPYYIKRNNNIEKFNDFEENTSNSIAGKCTSYKEVFETVDINGRLEQSNIKGAIDTALKNHTDYNKRPTTPYIQPISNPTEN